MDKMQASHAKNEQGERREKRKKAEKESSWAFYSRARLLELLARIAFWAQNEH